MSEKICPNCSFRYKQEDEFCQKCGSPLDLSEYIKSKKLDKNIPEKIRSLFGNRRIDKINDEIEEFIHYSLSFNNFMDDFGMLIAGNYNQTDFKKKYEKLNKLNDFKYLDIIKEDSDLNNKHLFLLKTQSFIDKFDYGMLDNVDNFFKDLDNLKKSNFYVTYIEKDNLKKKYEDTFGFVDQISEEIDLEGNFKNFYDDFQKLDSIIKKRNEKYVEDELTQHKDFFDNIDGKSLDKKQRLAVVTNEQNSQIIAGAGCGKTLTVNAKVRYLIEKKGVNPSEILCLSFSNASVADLKEKLPSDVEISTFHKLGGSILKANDLPSRPDSDSLDNFIREYFKNNVIDNKKLCEDIFEFYAYYFYNLVKEDDVGSIGELYDIEEGRDFRTLRDLYGGDNEKRTYDNKVVKSFEELVIANYLFAHQIDYEYEKVFECTNKYYNSQKEFIYKFIFENINEIKNNPMIEDLVGSLYDFCEIKEHIIVKDHVPDFYIKENKIYLEHFGVNKNCEALWLDEKGSDKYRKSIEWKRELHKKYGSTLIETYSYYMAENRLLDRLEEKLKNVGVEIKEIDYEYLFSKIIERDTVNKFVNFMNLITSFIQLFKGNDYGIGKFSEFKKENETNDDEFDKKRTNLFLNIVEEFYSAYENHLKENIKIDFNDMINNATREVEKGNLNKTYRYILVDEYQDTSYTRYNLVKAIQDKTGAKVCVVGDDWQSIYRFTGCDVVLFSKFENYFKNPEKLSIETTYRNSQDLIDISGRFIKKNPNQIDKSLKSKKDSTQKPVKIAYYNKSSSEDKIKTMEYLINKISRESNDIMILGRNNFDINDFIETGLFKRKRSDDSKLIYDKNNDLNINFISVHKSKGLEEENVILINLENSIAGFPNQMTDDPLMNFVINDSDQFPNGEERRLFYVALTRTKNNVYLLVPETDKSEFVIELENHIDDLEIISRDSRQEENYDDLDTFMENKNVYSIKTKLKCPVCKTGDVILKIIKTKDGKDIFKFLECSHRRCEWEGGPYFSKLELLDEIEMCPSCGDVRYVADGRYGPYLKCLNGCKTPKLQDVRLKRVKKILNMNIDYEYIESDLKCPNCVDGKISLKINPDTKKQEFACSNTLCDFEGGFTNIDKTQLNKIKICPECNGILVLRNGKYGEFYSCNSRNCKYTENISPKKPKFGDFKEISIDLKCPECNNGNIIIKKNKKTNQGKFVCSNCNWDGGTFDKSGKIESIEYCKSSNCNGVTYLRDGRFGEFRSCSNYFKTKCDGGKKSKKSRKTQKKKKISKWKRIDTSLNCPSCSGNVILLKNKEDGHGFFRCDNDSCDWKGGSFNKSEDVLNTLSYCPEPNCDGLTYEIEGKYGPFRVCTNFPKTGCNAGRKK